MAGVGRNFWLAALLIAGLAVGAVVLASAMWACALAALLGIAGVVLFRGNRWRTTALAVAAIALSMAEKRAVSEYIAGKALGAGGESAGLLARHICSRLFAAPICGRRSRSH